MNKLIVYPATDEQLNALKAFMQALNIQFEDSEDNEDSEYNEDNENSQLLDLCLQKTALITNRYIRLCNENRIKYEADFDKHFRNFMGAINLHTLQVFKDKTVAEQVTDLFNKCESWFDKIELATEETLELERETTQFFIKSFNKIKK